MTSNPDWPDDVYGFCECGHDLSDCSSHYHCANCGEEPGGHYRVRGGFTCSRVPGWWNE